MLIHICLFINRIIDISLYFKLYVEINIKYRKMFLLYTIMRMYYV